MNNSRAGILVVISGFLFHVIFFGFILNYNVMYLGLQNHFNSTEIETGIPGYVSYGIFSLATPLSTVFFTLTNHRTVVITGVILCCASLVISALVASIYILIFSFGVLFGLGANFFHIPSLHILIYYYSGKRYNQACVAVSTGVGAGILVSSLLLEKMFIEFGLKNTFLIYGGCALCIGLLLSITMVVPRQDNDETKTVSDSYLVVKEAETVIERDVKQGDNSNNVNLISDVKPTEISRDESECTFVREDEPLPSSPTVDKRETSNLMGGRKDFENGSTSSHIDKTTAIKKNTKFNSLKLFLDMIKTVNFWLCFPMFMLFYIAIPFSLVSLSSFMSERGIASHVIVRTLSLMGVIDLATRSTYVLVARCLPLSTCNMVAIMSCICAVLSILLSRLSISNDVIVMLAVGFSCPRAFLLMLTLPICTEVFGKKKSAIAMSLSYFFIGTGTLLSQPLLGTVYSTTDSYSTTLHVCTVLYAIPAVSYWILTLRLRRVKKQQRKNKFSNFL